jgi:hypothetical protein
MPRSTRDGIEWPHPVVAVPKRLKSERRMFGGGIWSIVVILGPIILAAAIAWALINNRTSKRRLDQTEQATRDLYDGDTADRRGN